MSHAQVLSLTSPASPEPTAVTAMASSPALASGAAAASPAALSATPVPSEQTSNPSSPSGQPRGRPVTPEALRRLERRIRSPVTQSDYSTVASVVRAATASGDRARSPPRKRELSAQSPEIGIRPLVGYTSQSTTTARRVRDPQNATDLPPAAPTPHASSLRPRIGSVDSKSSPMQSSAPVSPTAVPVLLDRIRIRPVPSSPASANGRSASPNGRSASPSRQLATPTRAMATVLSSPDAMTPDDGGLSRAQRLMPSQLLEEPRPRTPVRRAESPATPLVRADEQLWHLRAQLTQAQEAIQESRRQHLEEKVRGLRESVGRAVVTYGNPSADVCVAPCLRGAGTVLGAAGG